MKEKFIPRQICLFTAAALLLLFQTSARADVPPSLHHQGRIAVQGVNFEGTGQFKFALYESLPNGLQKAAVWKNNNTSPVNATSEPTAAVSLPVTKGLYTALLGSDPMEPLPEDIEPATGKVLFLAIWFSDGVNGFQRLLPDVRIGSVPFAKHAGSVESVPLSAIPGSVVRQGQDVSVLENDAGYLTAASELSSPSGDYVGRVFVGADGNVGIGAWEPEAALDIRGPLRIDVPTSPKSVIEYHPTQAPYLDLVTHAPINDDDTMATMSRYGVTLWGVSNPSSPVKVAEFADGDLGMNDLGSLNGIVFVEDHLLAISSATDDAVTFVDIGGGNVVARDVLKNGVGGVSTIADIRGIAAGRFDTLAIWTTSNNIVTLVDVGGPANPNPTVVATIDSANGVPFGFPTDVAIDGNLMVIGDGYTGSHLFDITDSSNPQWLGPVLTAELPLSYGNQRVDIKGNLVSVDYGSGELRLFDVSNPAAPRELRKVDSGSAGYGHLAGTLNSRLDGSGLLATAKYSGPGSVTISNVSDPRNPEVLVVFEDGESGFEKLNPVNRPNFGSGLLAMCGEDAVTIVPIDRNTAPGSDPLLAIGQANPGGNDILRVTEQEVRIGDHATVEGDLEVLGDLIFNPASLPSNVMLEGENVGLLNNDAGYMTTIAGKDVSLLNNDAGYLTSIAGMNISLLNNNAGYLTGIAGMNISLLNNNTGYTTRASMLGAENVWTGANIFDSDDGILAVGGNGGILAEGLGKRMLWYPEKSAFRAGEIVGSSGSPAENWNSGKTGHASAAFGRDTLASGDFSMAFGLRSDATGERSTAWGSNTEASGLGATAWGGGSSATGDSSTAWGVVSQATGNTSTAWGNSSIASGDYTTAFGYDTDAVGNYSVSFGRETDATGVNTTAFGYRSEASGRYSTASGVNTLAGYYGQFVLGRWNADTPPAPPTVYDGDEIWNNYDPLFTIGNGLSNISRTNAFSVHKSGRTIVGGRLVVGALEELRDGGGGLFVYQGQTGSNHSVNAISLYDSRTFISSGQSRNGYWGFLVEATNAGDGDLYLRSGVQNDVRGKFDRITGQYSTLSDRRLKKNIRPLEPVLDKVRDVELVRYQMKSEPDSQPDIIGVIAQDLREVFPEAVDGVEGEDSYLSVNYDDLSVVAVKAIQEQQEIIEKQATAIRALEERLKKAGL